MKNLLLVLLLINTGIKTPVSYTLNVAKSEIKWTGYAAAGAYAPTGSIKVKSGSLLLNGSSLAAAKVVIDMATLSHEKAELQSHLRGEDFFAVETFPEATFVLTAVKGSTAYGNLNIKGVTQPITFPFVASQENGALVVKITMNIDRTLFGIKYNSSSYFQDLGSYAIKK